MKRDERMFLVAMGQASPWNTFVTHLEASCFPSRRRRYGRFASVNAMLSLALADPGDRITIEIRRKRMLRPRRTASLTVLAVVTTVLILEWGTYSFPALANSIGAFAHNCGLR